MNCMINIVISLFGILFIIILYGVNKLINSKLKKINPERKSDKGGIYGSWWSIQNLVVIFGISFIILLPWVTSYYFNNYESLLQGNLKYILSTTMNGVYFLIGGFGIVLTILWGSLFEFYVKNKNSEEVIKLKGQSMVLTLLLFWLLISIYLTIIHPVIDKIN